MKRLCLLFALLLVGCSSAAPLPITLPDADDPLATLVGSAAAPFSNNPPVLALQNALVQAAAHLNSLTDLQADQVKRFQTANPEYIFQCAATDDLAVLACSMGPYNNITLAHTLFWQENGTWKGQFYPQAPGDVAQVRRAYFRSLGENCPVGCSGAFSALRQDGDMLLAVVNLSAAGPRRTEEPQLLKRTASGWELVWAPYPHEPHFQGNPQVVLPEHGIGELTTQFDDGRVLHWVLDGSSYKNP